MDAVWCCSKCGAIYHKDFPRCPNDGAEIIVSETDPLLGARIEHYVVDELIGEGGMGRVYRAHDATRPEKRFAIKVLLGDVAATGSMRKRFAKEAEIASRLDHPNLVGVVDFGETATGLPYIVMQLVEGEVLTDILERGPMNWLRVVRIARAVCDGIAYAHDAGLIHRDLKPDNIIIVATSKGEVPRITDFGLALAQEAGHERLTTTGMAMGTPAYAAPEQLAGRELDGRADLFALGMTMFEMLTGGVLPWQGNAMEIATAKAHREAPLLRTRCPELQMPDALEQLVARLVRRRRGERPDTVREVIAALDQLLARAPRRRARIRLLAAGMLAAGVAGGSWWLRTQTSTAAEPLAHASIAHPVELPPAPRPPPELPHEADVVSQPDVASLEPPARAAPARHKPVARPKVTVQKDRAGARKLGEQATKPVAALAVAPAAPTPPEPVELRATLASVDVSGSLPPAEVERAVRRAMSQVARCTPAQEQRITVQFTIGESRRPDGMHASGGSAGRCVAGALSAIRTETAPDVGEVTVIVHVAFEPRP